MEKFILYADNNDLSVVIDLFEFSPHLINYKNYEPFHNYFNELIDRYNSSGQYSLFGLLSRKDVWKMIRKLLLNTKVNEYTLNDNRLYSFNQVADIVLSDKRTNYLKDVLTYNQIIELGFVILQAKHIASINKIRLELESTSTELILEKYIDCLNYYILYELYDKTVEKI